MARRIVRNLTWGGWLAVAVMTGCAEAGRDGWTLVWSDEFAGETLDRSKWTFDLGNGFAGANGVWVPGWGNDEKQFYTDRPDNVYVKDGKLRIVARREAYEGFAYTSARLKTKGRFSTVYGRFEIRARLPAGKGLWPAVWMLPEENRYGGWAASGEIDIMEAKGSRPHEVSGAIHYGGEWPDNTFVYAIHTFPDGGTIENFHVYALEWEPGRLRWFADGTLFQERTAWHSGKTPGAPGHPPFPAPFDQPFHLLVNLAVGGHFDGDPDETTPFPAVMEIDYVRVYKKTVP